MYADHWSIQFTFICHVPIVLELFHSIISKQLPNVGGCSRSLNVVVRCWLWKPIYLVLGFPGLCCGHSKPHNTLCVIVIVQVVDILSSTSLSQKCRAVCSWLLIFWTLTHLISTLDCQRGVLPWVVPWCQFVDIQFELHAFCLTHDFSLLKVC